MAESNTVKLSKPITVGNSSVAELAFREPNGGDIADIGLPFAVEQCSNGTSGGKINTAAVGQYIARLSGNAPSIVKQLSPSDFFAGMNVVLSFFTEAMGTPPIDISNSPSSSAT